MKQYQVPQFITVEDKVIGPLTVKQALYVGAGVLLIVGVRYFLVPGVFWPLTIFLGGFSAALAFLKINEQPFPIILKNIFFYIARPRLFLWKKEVPPKEKPKEEIKKPEVLVKSIPTLSQSKLSDLAWSLDIKERVKD